MHAKLAANRYGKSRVRLMRVTKYVDQHDRDAYHDVDEWTVQVMLTGDFETAHTLGDNSKILATDTMKNTVYYVARLSKTASMEEYAMELIDYILARNVQVESAEVVIESAMWKRLTIEGKPDPTAFMRGSDERQTTVVTKAKGGAFAVKSGFDRLTVMKTAKSGFVGYIQESLTTLPETTDRLFATAVKAEWPYTAKGLEDGIDFNKVRGHLRETIVTAFAKHDSLSVQQTMFAMGEAALGHTDIISEVYLLMPNKHQLLVDMSRFGQKNPNHIFMPTDEPHGTIEATVVRA
jgi:urate oxidase